MLCSSQIRKRLIVSDKGQLEWKKMYFKLCRCYPHKEQYTDTLQFCTHCHILFWKVTNLFLALIILFENTLTSFFFSIYGNFMAITDFFFFSVHFRIQTILALPITQRAAASLSLHRVSSTFSNSRGRCIAAMYIVSIVQRIPG